jgi:hypothetical protein
VSEKKAISEPATKKDIKKRMMTAKRRMVVAAGVIASKLIKRSPGKIAE